MNLKFLDGTAMRITARLKTEPLQLGNDITRLGLSFVFYAFLFFAPWSNSGVQTVLAIGVILALIRIIFYHEQVETRGLLKYVILYYMVYLIAGIFSGDFMASMRSLAYEWLPLTVILWGVVKPDEEQVKRGFNILVGVSFIFVVYAIVQHFIGLDVIRGSSLKHFGRFYRVTGPYGGAMTFSAVYFLITALVFGLIWAKDGRESRKGWFYLPFLFLAIIALIFSYTRSIWLGGSVAILAVALVIKRIKIERVIIAFLLFWLLVVILSPSVIDRFFALLNPELPSRLTRFTLLKTAWQMIKANPIVGMGAGGWLRNFDRYFTGGYYKVKCHPHNDYLNILVEAGILGLIVYLSMFIFFFKRILRAIKTAGVLYRGIAFGAFIAVVGIMVAGLFECYFVDDEVEALLFFIMSMGVIASVRSISKSCISLRVLTASRDKRSGVLVVRTDRVGDLILSSPIAEVLKMNEPDLRIDFLASSYAAPIIKANPFIDDIHIYRGFWETVKLMSKYRLVIFAHPTLLLAIAGFLARVPLRLGTAWRFYSILFNIRHREHRKGNKFHELEYNLHLLTPIMGNEPAVPALRVYLPAEAVREAEKFNIPSPFVVIHPGGLGSSLRWSAKRYGELVRLLVDAGIRIVITGSEKERDLCAKVGAVREPSLHQPTDMVHNLCGKTDILTLAGLIKLSSLVITNSTGILHIADGLGVKVLGIFPPVRGMSPVRWGPYNQPQNIIMPDVPSCKKCIGKRCEFYYCMDSITADEVFRRVRELLV